MMKKTFTLIAIMLLLATHMFAQKLSYQAVIRNSNNELVYNASLTVEVSILGPYQNVLYSQTIQNVNSNQNGLITIQIGDDSPAWRAIDWSDATIRSVIKDGTTTVATVNSAVSAVPLAIQTLNASNNGQVQANWEETDQNSPAFIQNKPTIPTALDMSGYVTTEQLQNAGYLSQEADPTVPAWAKEQTKPTYSYNEITGTPTIPTVNNGVLTITQGDSSYTFSANTDQNVAVTLPQIPEMPSMDDIAGAMGNMGFLRYETQTLSDVAAHGNDAGSRQLKGLADPTDAQDAVTLSYLMEQVNNLQQQLNRLSQVVADQQAVIDSLTNGGGNGGDPTVVPTTFTCGGNLIDGNNRYTTHQFGNQCWMTQNLRNASGSDRIYYPEVLTACPDGWHLPSQDEWLTLGNYLPSYSESFGKSYYMTTNATMPWQDGDGNAYTLMVSPAYVDNNNSVSIFNSGVACEFSDIVNGVCCLDDCGFAVRCVREETGGDSTSTTTQAPTATTKEAGIITETTATLFAYVSNPDNVTITAKGFEYKVSGSANYTTVDSYVNSQDDDGFGIYAPLYDLTAGTSYTYRAFVTTAEGTSYGSEMTFTTTEDSTSCPSLGDLIGQPSNVLRFPINDYSANKLNASASGYLVYYNHHENIWSPCLEVTKSAYDNLVNINDSLIFECIIQFDMIQDYAGQTVKIYPYIILEGCDEDRSWIPSSSVDLVVPTINTSANVGDILLNDNSWVSPNDFNSETMTAKGVIFHVDETGQHGWAVNLHHENEGYALAWSVYNQGGNSYNVDIENLPNYTSYDAALSDTAGYQNTTAIRAAMDYQIFHVASQVNLMEGWYVPACGQLAVLMQNLTTVNSSLATVNGTEIPTKWIWSSTEYGSDRAWGVGDNGNISNVPKGSGYKVRSVRSF